jgi:hypothetical protein
VEILGLNILLPAAVNYRTESGEHTAFCYINQMNGEVTVVDEVADTQALQKAVAEYMKSKVRKRVIPAVPQKGFEKMDPRSYSMNDE